MNPDPRARFNLEYEVMRDIEELPVGDRFGETAADRLQQELATKCDERLLEKALESILRN
jgi:plasmid stabilization system protein ParE